MVWRGHCYPSDDRTVQIAMQTVRVKYCKMGEMNNLGAVGMLKWEGNLGTVKMSN